MYAKSSGSYSADHFGGNQNIIYFSSKILKVRETYEYFCLIKFFKDVILEHSRYFSNRLASIQGSNRRNTRFNIQGNFVVPHFNSVRGQNSFIYKSVSLWNLLPHDIKCCTDVEMFKTKLYNFLLTRYSVN